MACDMAGDVKMFQLACDQLKEVGVEASLYYKLIKEEFDELCDASIRVEELDAIADLIWVLIGYAHARGYNIEGAWNEVARSNMSKIDPVSGKVIKRADGKILKPETFSPPNLQPFI